MPSTFNNALRIEEIADGEQAGIWGATTNNNLGNLLVQAITGNTAVSVTAGNITLTSLNGVTDEARSAVLVVSGTPGTTRVITIPSASKAYTVRNTSNATVQIKTASGTAYNCPTLSESYVYCDGTNTTGRTITDNGNTLVSASQPSSVSQSLGIAPTVSPALSGTPTTPTATPGTNTTQIASTAFVGTAIAAIVTIPAGVITMWSGSIASIPSGWLLCNGSGGTPDLRDRFVMGAGSTYAVGAVGGSSVAFLSTANLPAHTHTGTTASTSIAHTHGFSATSGATDLSHTHTGSGTTSGFSNDHTHGGTTNNNNVGHFHGVSGNTGTQSANHIHTGSTDTQGVHNHNYTSLAGGPADSQGTSFGAQNQTLATSAAGAHAHNVTTTGVSADHFHSFAVNSGDISANHVHSFSTGGQSANHDHTYSFTTSTFSGNHTHAVSGTTGSTDPSHAHTFTTNSTGSGTAFGILPPYYALAYIMKL